MTNKLFFAILKKYLFLCIAMAIISALGISVLGSMSSFIYSSDEALYSYLDEYNYADIVISTSPIPEDETSPLAELNWVKDFEMRASTELLMKTSDGIYLAISADFRSQEDFTKFYFWQTAEPSDDYDSVWIEFNFAKNNGITAGDTVEIRNDDEFNTYFVSSIVSSPETLALSGIDTSSFSPVLGAVYFDKSMLIGTEFEGYCNKLLFKTQAGANNKKVMNTALSMLSYAGITVTDSYYRDNSPVVNRIEDNIDPVRILCKFIPTFFYVVVLCVLFLCISILVVQCRKEIGILRALGFTIHSIRKVFVFLAIFIAILGACLSYPLIQVVTKMCCDFYRDFYPVPEFPPLYNWTVIVIAAVINLIISIIAAIGGCRHISSIQPSEAMRNAIPASEKTPGITDYMSSPILKFNFTTLLRNKKRLYFTIFCIASTVMIFFSSLSFKSANDCITSQLLDERVKYDSIIFFSEEPSDTILDELESLEYVNALQVIRYYTVNVSSESGSERITINAIPQDTSLITIPDVSVLPDEGIILEKYAADALNVSVGDHVSVNNVSMTVKGISEQYTSKTSYISLLQSDALNSPSVGTLICCTDDQPALSEYVSGLEDYLCISFTSDVRKTITELFDSYNFIVWIFIAFSVVIGLVIVVTTMKTSLLRRQRELCVMRTLGFYRSEISFSWLIQSFIQLIFSIIIGLPLGVAAAKLILKQINTDLRTYPFSAGPREYITAALLVTSYVLLSHFFSMNSIRRWNLAEVIKSTD